ncbi:MAG: photosynthetic complex putative assembly protein PuhB [Pseudomonadota bacterium]
MSASVPRVSVVGQPAANEESAETVLWSGQPSYFGMFWRAFAGRWVALYLTVLLVFRLLDTVARGGGSAELVGAVVSVALLTTVLALLLGGLARLMTRASTYTITDRRVVFDSGVALPMRIDVPLSVIDRADLLRHRDGSGDIVFTLAPGERAKYLVLWPHVRPFSWLRVQPTLRSVTDLDGAVKALAAASGAQADCTHGDLAAADPGSAHGVVAG